MVVSTLADLRQISAAEAKDPNTRFSHDDMPNRLSRTTFRITEL